jgi:hypothetical protein
VTLHRTTIDRFRHWGYPTWPPEAITELTREQSGIQFVFRDEWVPYAPDCGESLWRAVQRQNGKWVTSRIRYMKYETTDSSIRTPVSRVRSASFFLRTKESGARRASQAMRHHLEVRHV